MNPLFQKVEEFLNNVEADQKYVQTQKDLLKVREDVSLNLHKKKIKNEHPQSVDIINEMPFKSKLNPIKDKDNLMSIVNLNKKVKEINKMGPSCSLNSTILWPPPTGHRPSNQPCCQCLPAS